MAWLAWIQGLREPEAQVWHDIHTGQAYYKDTEPRGPAHQLFLYKRELKPGEERESIDELKKRYPYK